MENHRISMESPIKQGFEYEKGKRRKRSKVGKKRGIQARTTLYLAVCFERFLFQRWWEIIT
jgi:hypothetical protein